MMGGDPMVKHVLSEIPAKEYIISDERKAELDAMYSPEVEIARLQEQVETLTRKNERLENTLKLHSGDLMSLNNEVELFRSHWNGAEARALAAEAERDRLRDFADWVDTWVSNPATSYSVYALDGLFAMTRDRLAALQKEPQP